MSKKSRRKREILTELTPEKHELQKAFSTKKWEYDFDVTNKYTFEGIQNEFLHFIQQDTTLNFEPHQPTQSCSETLDL